jgi:arylsulfatase
MRRPGWTTYEAGMAQLDDSVGTVMKKLKDEGLEDNTMVELFQDHSDPRLLGRGARCR